MADYRLPMDADGVKYHGTVDQNEENPGQFMYGLDENGNKRIIRTDEQGNVLTRVTGSIVEEDVLWKRDVRQGFTPSNRHLTPVNGARGFVLILKIYGLTGTFNSDEGYRLRYSKVTHSSYFTEFVSSEWSTRSGNRSCSLITVYPDLLYDDGNEGFFLTRVDLPYPARW